jgi:hypothetical protein
MVTLTLRLGATGATGVKNAPLTNAEIDTNFSNLNDAVEARVLLTDYEDSDILTKIKTVDGSGSGLDADLLDGLNTSSTDQSGNSVVTRSGGSFSANQITANTVNANLYVGATQAITFEGSTADAYETTLTVVDPTADRTISLPNLSGTLVVSGAGGAITNDMLAGSIANNKLAHSSITLDGNTIALGESLNIGAGLTSGVNTWTGTQTFRDNKFVVTDDADTTKILNLQLSNITTNTTRTLTVPNESGTIATQSYAQTYVQTNGKNSQGSKTVSSSAPSGGSNGDIWYRV